LEVIVESLRKDPFNPVKSASAQKLEGGHGEEMKGLGKNCLYADFLREPCSAFLDRKISELDLPFKQMVPSGYDLKNKKHQKKPSGASRN